MGLFGFGKSGKGGEEQPPVRQEEIVPIALATLLLDTALVNGVLEAVDQQKIQRFLEQKLGCTRAQAAHFLQEADAELQKPDYFYTCLKTLKDSFDAAGRLKILEMVWGVVQADAITDPTEIATVRRISGLLNISEAECEGVRVMVEEQNQRRQF
jgi:uncharacterized tellurite resistance protein B-like protein